MLLSSLNGTLNHVNQTTYQPVIVPGSYYNLFANLNDHNSIQIISQSIAIQDETKLLKMIKLPLNATNDQQLFSNRRSVSQLKGDKVEQDKSNDTRLSNQLENRLSPINLETKLEQASLNDEDNSSSEPDREPNSELSIESNGESSSKLDSKSNSKVFSYNFNRDKLGQWLDNRVTYRSNDQVENSPADHHPNSSSPSSSTQPSFSFLSSFISTLFRSEYLTSLADFEQNTLESIRSPVSYSSLTKQLSPTFDLLNASVVKLPMKAILNSKNETLINTHLNTMPLVNATQLNMATNNIAYEYPPYIRNSATVIFVIIFFFGTLGNILVSLIIFRSKELRNTTNYFLVNLSIADLLVIIVCMPTVLIELHSKPEIWLLGEFMCK